jgi:hypothetical protein
LLLVWLVALQHEARFKRRQSDHSSRCAATAVVAELALPLGLGNPAAFRNSWPPRSRHIEPSGRPLSSHVVNENHPPKPGGSAEASASWR